MHNITIRCPRFYSLRDEDNFFSWLDGSLKSLESCLGKGEELTLYFSSPRIPESDLRELIAIFERYRIEPKSLSSFLNEDNRSWFYDKSRYWFSPIFESNRTLADETSGLR